MSPTPSPAQPFLGFGVVVPVKRVAVAKSRLQALGDEVRRELVSAFAVDTVLAALDCPAVRGLLVVTDDVELALGLRDLGIDAVPDGESGSLNASLRQGAAELLRRRPELSPVALCADLPALRPEDLGDALLGTTRPVGDGGSGRPAFVSDAAGVGTTMFVARSLETFRPSFGAGSRDAHLAQGATEIPPPGLASLRRDVDTPEDLKAAAALGVGPRTSWVITRRGLLSS